MLDLSFKRNTMKINLAFALILTASMLLMGETDGEALYKKKCTSCHGINAQKRALNTSKVINTLKKEEITKALIGYKNGSYGGKMKGFKKGLVKSLSEDDMCAISIYIQTLRPQ